MTTTQAQTPAHTGVALNHAETHENKIHSDEIAAKLGFEGALVPGVTVFGLTSIALTKQFGGDWLEGTTVHTRFLKPAYHNDTLEIFLATSDQQSEARCHNKDDTLLCTLQKQTGTDAPEFDQHNFDLSTKPIASDRKNRPEISWETIQEDVPFPVRPWRPSTAENAKFAKEVQDDHNAFTKQGADLVHPHFILSQANQALVDEFEMPSWIHVGSEIRLHRALKQSTDYRVFSVPVRKWRHKGHEFVTVYIAYEHSGEAHAEIFHTAIYRIAGV